MKALLASALLCCVLTNQASAQSPVLDQQNVFLGFGSGSVAVAYNYSDVQTLTCGLEGILSRVDVEVLKGTAATNDLVLSLWSIASDGSPLSQLTSSSLPAASIHPANSVALASFTNFSQDITVTPGEQIGIRLDSAAPNASPYTMRYNWLYQSPGQYADGRMFIYGDSAVDQPGSDFYFKTFVTPVPEPGMLSLLALGTLLCFGTRLRWPCP